MQKTQHASYLDHAKVRYTHIMRLATFYGSIRLCRLYAVFASATSIMMGKMRSSLGRKIGLSMFYRQPLVNCYGNTTPKVGFVVSLPTILMEMARSKFWRLQVIDIYMS